MSEFESTVKEPDARSAQLRRIGSRIAGLILAEEFDEAVDVLDAVGDDFATALQESAVVRRTNLLLQAAAGGSAKLVLRLLDTGCFKIDERDSTGVTALFSAVQGGHLDVVKALAERGACIESDRLKNGAEHAISLTALVVALVRGREDIALYLLERGASTASTVKDGGGRSIAQLAVDKDLLEVFKQLCRLNYFDGDPVGTVALVVRNESAGKILNFCLAFPLLAETVSGRVINPRISDGWSESARQKIMAWRMEQSIQLAIEAPADTMTPSRRAGSLCL